MPPRTRSTASRTPGQVDGQVSTVEKMADDAQIEPPKQFPPGAPEFKPLLAVRPRGRRAEFKRKYAEIAEMNTTIEELQAQAGRHKQGSNARYAAELRMWAQMDELGELVEAALRLVAVDAEAFDKWAIEVSDEDLMNTFSVYQSRTQPGEASSSTN